MKSFRFRLTVWNTVVLLLVLVSFGATAAIVTERTVVGNIDRDLREIADRMARGPGAGPVRAGPGAPQPREGRRFEGDPYVPRTIGPDLAVAGPEPRPVLSSEGFSAARDKGTDLRTEEIEGRSVRVMSVRREFPGGWNVVQFGRDLTEVEAALAQLRTVLLLMLPVAVVVAAVGGMFLVGRALKPVEDVTQAAAKIGAEDLSMRLDVAGDDELAELARTFNEMIARLEGSFATLEEAYDAQKRFVADASHELRTPLSRVKLLTSATLTQRASEEEKTEALRTIDHTADEMTRLVEGLLQLARAEAGALALVHEPLLLTEVVQQSVESLENDSRVSLDVSEGGRALGDADAVRRIVVNLVSNAQRHTPAEGHIRVTVRGSSVTVEDDGEGIPVADLARVKERFYRADPSRAKASGGAGLGLAICESLARAMGGSLDVRSQLGKGTTVTLNLQSQSSQVPHL